MRYAFILLFCFSELVAAQTDGAFRGRVIENDAYRTPLYGATLYFPDLETGTTTNLSGYFTIKNLPDGEHRLRISFVGYRPLELTIRLPVRDDEEPIYVLERDAQELGELQVVAEGVASPQREQAPLSTIEISSLPLNTMPRLLGEPDLIRIVQNLPGVKTDSDFTGGFYVRGGRSDQNLILLDGVPVYNPWHLFGIFSAFNNEAIDQVELTKGIFPARYGGRASSLLNIGLQRGSERLGAGYLTISPLSASFSYGRPINQKTSYLIALRRTYMDPVFWFINRQFAEENEYKKDTHDLGYFFYDLNVKLVHRLSSRMELEAAWFRNNDQLKGDTKTVAKTTAINADNYIGRQQVGWKNQTLSLRAKTHGAYYTTETQGFLSFYTSSFLDGMTDLYAHSQGAETRVETEESLFKQRFLDTGVQQHFTFFAGDRNTIHAGAEWVLHHFGDESHALEWVDIYPFPVSETYDRLNKQPFNRQKNHFNGNKLKTTAGQVGGYISSSVYLGNFSVHPGIRYEYYSKGGYHSWLPRINVKWQGRSPLHFSAGYGEFSQYIHIVGVDMARFPTDRWFWSNEERTPLRVKTTTFGVGYDFTEDISLSIEGYYKNMNNLLSLDPVAEREAIDELETLPIFTGNATLSGDGEMYGVELFAQKADGKVTGWLGYTLSWAWNQFDELNLGRKFPARTDKRHDIQLFVNWDIAENWAVGGLFNYKTGQPITFATGHYQQELDPLDIGEDGDQSTEVILERNNFRMPAYHRLDLNITWKNRSIFKRRSELSLNVINVYNRFNPWMMSSRTRVTQVSDTMLEVDPSNRYTGQLPVLPMLSLRIALGGDAR